MDEWNVVSRKRGAGRRLAAPYLNSSWARRGVADEGGDQVFPKAVLDDLGIVDNEEEEQKLLGRVKRAIVKVEQSSFYEKFMKQMEDLQVMEKLVPGGHTGHGPVRAHEDRIEDIERSEGTSSGCQQGDGERRVEQVSLGVGMEEDEEEKGMKKGDDFQVEMILYGVGSIYTAEIARCQLALALLIKQKFISIGELLVFDPIMTPIECRVMRTLGCVPLETNDNGRRPVSGRTLFYMPHNEVELYDSVVRTSLDPFKLNQIVIIGNSFRTYSERWTTYPLPDGEIPSYLLKAQEFVEEIPIADEFYPSAFSDTSWHLFFNVEARLLR